MIAENNERASISRRTTRRTNPSVKKEEIYDSDEDGRHDSRRRAAGHSDRETRSKTTQAVKVEHDISFGGEPMEE